MLISDYALATSEINEGIAACFLREGCRVAYRPFYPNLVREDVTRYGGIVLLAGRTPAFPSGAMSLHEVGIASAFVREGGALVLGPNLEGGEGAHERHVFNRLLDGLGVAIRVCNDRVEDEVNGYPATLGGRPFYRPVPGHPVSAGVADRLAVERSTSLAVGPDAVVLLRSFDTARPRGSAPVMAMARAGKGFVLVAGRFLLNAMGIPLRISGEPLVHPEWLSETGTFLQNLIGHLVGLRRGAVEWAPICPQAPGEIGPVGPADFELDRAPVLDRLPAGVRVETIGREGLAEDPREVDVYDRDLAADYERLPDERRYGWIRKEGVRASWGTTVDWAEDVKDRAGVEQVTGALKACGVNLFWGISNCQALGGPGYSEAEKSAVRRQWDWTAAGLDGSPVRWFPTLDYRYFREERTRCYGAQGQKLDAPSPMDLVFWREGWLGAMRAIAEFSLAHPCVGGVCVDMELYAHPPAYNYYTGYGFEDLCFLAALERWKGWVDDGLLREAAAVQLPGRFDWLRRHGLLEVYFTTLGAEVERVCRAIREEVWRVNPDLLFASYIFTTPCNWFDLAVYRGFSTPERPLILMTFNVRSGRMLAHLRRRGVYAYHASVVLLGSVRREEYGPVFSNAMRYGHGYWMNRINTLLEGDPRSLESPARQGLSPEGAIQVIREANESVAGPASQ